MIIPYTTERRPDTGVNNVTLGIWLFLASEVMLFGALFSAYALLRMSAPQWSTQASVLLGLINTLILIQVTALSWRARSARPALARTLLIISSLMALAFLVVKSLEWNADFNSGLRPATNTDLALYFTLTGLHALHVIAGLVGNAWAAAGAGRIDDAMLGGRVRALSLYWLFVDVVWLIIFVLMYLA